jgi:hypothetical protein
MIIIIFFGSFNFLCDRRFETLHSPEIGAIRGGMGSTKICPRENSLFSNGKIIFLKLEKHFHYFCEF